MFFMRLKSPNKKRGAIAYSDVIKCYCRDVVRAYLNGLATPASQGLVL